MTTPNEKPKLYTVQLTARQAQSISAAIMLATEILKHNEEFVDWVLKNPGEFSTNMVKLFAAFSGEESILSFDFDRAGQTAKEVVSIAATLTTQLLADRSQNPDLRAKAQRALDLLKQRGQR